MEFKASELVIGTGEESSRFLAETDANGEFGAFDSWLPADTSQTDHTIGRWSHLYNSWEGPVLELRDGGEIVASIAINQDNPILKAQRVASSQLMTVQLIMAGDPIPVTSPVQYFEESGLYLSDGFSYTKIATADDLFTISADTNNALTLKEDGLFVAKPTVTDVTFPGGTSMVSNTVATIPFVTNTAHGILSTGKYKELFPSSIHTIYIDTNFEGEDNTGSQVEPYTTLQGAIENHATGDTTIFIVKAGSVIDEEIEIPRNLTHANIVAENDVEGQFRITMTNNVNIRGTEIGLRGFEIQGSLTLGDGRDTVAYIENCAIAGETLLNTADWCELKSCEIEANIIATNGTLYIKDGDFENNSSLLMRSSSTVIANNVANMHVVNNGGKFYCQNCSFLSTGLPVYTASTNFSDTISMLASGTTLQEGGWYAPILIESGTYAIGNSFDYGNSSSTLAGTDVSNYIVRYQPQLKSSTGTVLAADTPIYSKNEVDSMIGNSGGAGVIGIYDYGIAEVGTMFPTTDIPTGATVFHFPTNQVWTFNGTDWDRSGDPLNPQQGNRIDVIAWVDGTSATGIKMDGLYGFGMYSDDDWYFFADAVDSWVFGPTIQTNDDGSLDVADVNTGTITESETKFNSNVDYNFTNFIIQVISKINGLNTIAGQKYVKPTNGIPSSDMAGSSVAGQFLKTSTASTAPTWATLAVSDIADIQSKFVPKIETITNGDYSAAQIETMLSNSIYTGISNPQLEVNNSQTVYITNSFNNGRVYITPYSDTQDGAQNFNLTNVSRVSITGTDTRFINTLQAKNCDLIINNIAIETLIQNGGKIILSGSTDGYEISVELANGAQLIIDANFTGQVYLGQPTGFDTTCSIIDCRNNFGENISTIGKQIFYGEDIFDLPSAVIGSLLSNSTNIHFSGVGFSREDSESFEIVNYRTSNISGGHTTIHSKFNEDTSRIRIINSKQIVFSDLQHQISRLYIERNSIVEIQGHMIDVLNVSSGSTVILNSSQDINTIILSTGATVVINPSHTGSVSIVNESGIVIDTRDNGDDNLSTYNKGVSGTFFKVIDAYPDQPNMTAQQINNFFSNSASSLSEKITPINVTCTDGGRIEISNYQSGGNGSSNIELITEQNLNGIEFYNVNSINLLNGQSSYIPWLNVYKNSNISINCQASIDELSVRSGGTAYIKTAQSINRISLEEDGTVYILDSYTGSINKIDNQGGTIIDERPINSDFDNETTFMQQINLVNDEDYGHNYLAAEIMDMLSNKLNIGESNVELNQIGEDNILIKNYQGSSISHNRYNVILNLNPGLAKIDLHSVKGIYLSGDTQVLERFNVTVGSIVKVGNSYIDVLDITGSSTVTLDTAVTIYIARLEEGSSLIIPSNFVGSINTIENVGGTVIDMRPESPNYNNLSTWALAGSGGGGPVPTNYVKTINYSNITTEPTVFTTSLLNSTLSNAFNISDVTTGWTITRTDNDNMLIQNYQNCGTRITYIRGVDGGVTPMATLSNVRGITLSSLMSQHRYQNLYVVKSSFVTIEGNYDTPMTITNLYIEGGSTAVINYNINFSSIQIAAGSVLVINSDWQGTLTNLFNNGGTIIDRRNNGGANLSTYIRDGRSSSAVVVINKSGTPDPAWDTYSIEYNLSNAFNVANSALIVARTNSEAINLNNYQSSVDTVLTSPTGGTTSSANFRNVRNIALSGNHTFTALSAISNSFITINQGTVSNLTIASGSTVYISGVTVSTGTTTLSAGATLVIYSGVTGNIGSVTNNGGTVIDLRNNGDSNLSTFTKSLKLISQTTAIANTTEIIASMLTNAINIGNANLNISRNNSTAITFYNYSHYGSRSTNIASMAGGTTSSVSLTNVQDVIFSSYDAVSSTSKPHTYTSMNLYKRCFIKIASDPANKLSFGSISLYDGSTLSISSAINCNSITLNIGTTLILREDFVGSENTTINNYGGIVIDMRNNGSANLSTYNKISADDFVAIAEVSGEGLPANEIEDLLNNKYINNSQGETFSTSGDLHLLNVTTEYPLGLYYEGDDISTATIINSKTIELLDATGNDLIIDNSIVEINGMSSINYIVLTNHSELTIDGGGDNTGILGGITLSNGAILNIADAFLGKIVNIQNDGGIIIDNRSNISENLSTYPAKDQTQHLTNYSSTSTTETMTAEEFTLKYSNVNNTAGVNNRVNISDTDPINIYNYQTQAPNYTNIYFTTPGTRSLINLSNTKHVVFNGPGTVSYANTLMRVANYSSVVLINVYATQLYIDSGSTVVISSGCAFNSITINYGGQLVFLSTAAATSIPITNNGGSVIDNRANSTTNRSSYMRRISLNSSGLGYTTSAITNNLSNVFNYQVGVLNINLTNAGNWSILNYANGIDSENYTTNVTTFTTGVDSTVYLSNVRSLTIAGALAHTITTLRISNQSAITIEGNTIGELIVQKGSTVTLQNNAVIGTLTLQLGGIIVIDASYTGTITEINNKGGIIIDARNNGNVNLSTYVSRTYTHNIALFRNQEYLALSLQLDTDTAIANSTDAFNRIMDYLKSNSDSSSRIACTGGNNNKSVVGIARSQSNPNLLNSILYDFSNGVIETSDIDSGDYASYTLIDSVM